MASERVVGGGCDPPFPVYAHLADELAAAHHAGNGERDATVAHVLATCAAYAYSDADTVATMMTRLGLDANACVRVTQTVDAMFIFSTAYLVQSRCGRVVVLCYRGTEPATLGNWLGDAEVGSESSTMTLKDGAPAVRVHAGFHRNDRHHFVHNRLPFFCPSPRDVVGLSKRHSKEPAGRTPSIPLSRTGLCGGGGGDAVGW